MEAKSFSVPDEVRKFDKGRVQRGQAIALGISKIILTNSIFVD
jgi:hypothetical protein